MSTARRDFMRNVGIGGVAIMGSSAVAATVGSSVANAQETAEDISPADRAILENLEAVELATAELLTQAVDRNLLDATTNEACRLFARHNQAHGDALAALVGGTTGQTVAPSPEVLATGAQIQAAGSTEALLEVLATLAERVAATGQVALERLGTIVGASVVARISPVDAQQAAYLGERAGRTPDEWLPLTQPTTGAFTV